MENENDLLILKIRSDITAYGGLCSNEIARGFFGIKADSPINHKLISGIFKNYPQIYFDGEKWQSKTWDFSQESQSCGVFGFYDENKKVIFVGSAVNLREKLLSLNVPDLYKMAASYIVSPCDDEESAIDIERKLIAKHKPILNL
jgi:hypothetical protein